jgi:hypothetical protein
MSQTQKPATGAAVLTLGLLASTGMIGWQTPEEMQATGPLLLDHQPEEED